MDQGVNPQLRLGLPRGPAGHLGQLRGRLLRRPRQLVHPPLLDYELSAGRCSVIGGYRYRGRAYRALLLDSYLYADFCSGEIWALAHLPDGRWTSAQVGSHAGNISSFGESILDRPRRI